MNLSDEEKEAIRQARSAVRAVDLSRERQGVCVSTATRAYEKHLRLLLKIVDRFQPDPADRWRLMITVATLRQAAEGSRAWAKRNLRPWQQGHHGLQEDDAADRILHACGFEKTK